MFSTANESAFAYSFFARRHRRGRFFDGSSRRLGNFPCCNGYFGTWAWGADRLLGSIFLVGWNHPCCVVLLSNGVELGFSPMAKVIAQEVSLLSSSKNGLVYLTPNDWALVADKAARVNFRKGQTLVHRGMKSNGVYLLLKGTARVQLPARGVSPEIGPGQICGEMSFLEDAPASADVLAREDVEAYLLDRSTLESLFELFPHLASRFYRSLATNLSHRLRDLIEPSGEAIAARQRS
jgi:Cyclic nucleotide-binding domain